MSENYEVGYGKPPKQTQFKPGQSGNPGGRPKGSKNLSTVMNEILSRRVTITENGKTRRVSYIEAYGHNLAAKGLHGTARDQIAVLKAINDYAPDALKPEDAINEITIHFVKSDGNGGLRKYSKHPKASGAAPETRKPDESAGAESHDNNDAAREAAWRASGIDDED